MWVHEEHSSKDDVIFSKSIFAEAEIGAGDLIELTAAQRGSDGKAQETPARPITDVTTHRKSSQTQSHDGLLGRKSSEETSSRVLKDETTPSRCRKQTTSPHQRYLFLVPEGSSEPKMKSSNLQVSLTSHVASLFGFKNRMPVQVAKVDKTENSASHVELAFRDEYLSRSDMWRLVMAELSQKTVYRGQKFIFIGSIKARVRNVYIRGRKVSAAYFAVNTKPIFRSESARHVLFLQMSKEMWEFDPDGSGDIMFNKVINGFLPELFKRWEGLNARHLVSIVLFTRLQYDYDPQAPWGPSSSRYSSQDPQQRHHRDFYRVVVSEAASLRWATILDTLKREFRVFWRDISLGPPFHKDGPNSGSGDPRQPELSDGCEIRVIGNPTAASRGNVLEAISMASSQFSEDYVDRDLVRTGLSVVIVTPGVGFFEVDYNLLRWTTENLTNNGVGVDLVCLARLPLHSVPLFKYQNPALLQSSDQATHAEAAGDETSGRTSGSEFKSIIRHSRSSLLKSSMISVDPTSAGQKYAESEEWIFAVPTWIDISFWTSPSRNAASQCQAETTLKNTGSPSGEGHDVFIPRAKMYELQMMGIMENEMSNISLPQLHHGVWSPLGPKEDAATHGRNMKTFGSDDSVGRHQSRGKVLNHARRGITPASAKYGHDRLNNRAERGQFDWMDRYDQQVFRPLQLRQDSVRGTAQCQSGAERYRKHVDHDSRLRTPSVDLALSSEDAARQVLLEKSPRHRVPEVGRSSPGQKLKSEDRGYTIRSPRLPCQLGNRRTGRHSLILKSTASTGLSAENVIFDSLATSEIPEHTANLVSQRPRSESKLDGQTSIVMQEQPPSQPIPIKHPAKSGEKDENVEKDSSPTYSKYPETMQQREKVNVLQAASIVKQAGPKLDLASGAPALSQTLHPNSALAPWLNALNPSHPRKHGVNATAEFGRWQHVFPHAVRAATVKWKSLCSPAAVPLTTQCFPTMEQLATEYHENPYTVTLEDDEDATGPSRGVDDLFKELVGMRLAQGFQFVIGDAVASTLRHPLLRTTNIFNEQYATDDGAMIVMSLGNAIHQMQRVGGGDVEIKRFVRKPTSIDNVAMNKYGSSWKYDIWIRTSLAEDYERRQLTLGANPDEYNWNYVDSFLAGHTDSYTEQLRFWRARFVLIPAEQPTSVRNASQLPHEDNEEETRIEGIRKFTQLLQRCRHIPSEDRRPQGRDRAKLDANPLDIIYQTRDSSVVVAAELDNLPLLDADSSNGRRRLLADEEPFRRANVQLHTLAQEIQGEKGVPMQDRRWHWRLHYNCFIGSEMTTWLLENFADVESREEAVELGNELMESGLFQHVERRHHFRDGNFFFQLGSDYRNPRAETRRSWFGSKRPDKSVPGSEISKDSPHTERPRVGHVAESGLGDSDGTCQTLGGCRKLRIALSNVMRYDVDHRRRSYRPEIINLHYDRLHHPDNCYHLRIDWMNVTAKLIEDAIVTWATTVEKYGLRLVEVPIREIASIAENHPLRSPYVVKLARTPPASLPQYIFDADSLAPRSKPDPHFYQKALMRRFGFVLDIEAASNFPADVEVTYSWGRPDYRFTQYIHRSGLLLAQITDVGDFLLLANRLCNNRSAGSNDKFERAEARDRRSGNHLSPFASPLVRATQDLPGLNAAQAAAAFSSVTAEELKELFEAFCSDVEGLRHFYDEVRSNVVSPSLATIMPGASIPSLGLPPSVASRDFTSASSAEIPGAQERKPSPQP